MSKISGIIIIILGILDYFTGFIQCSNIGYTLFGLIPPLDHASAGCSALTVVILVILGVGLFFWKTNESNFISKKKK